MTVTATTHPLRLAPGADLHAALLRFAARPGRPACMLVAGLGSLDGACLRPAGGTGSMNIDGDLEIIALSGTLTHDGIHVHLAVADAAGRMSGGHLLPGCRIRTTAELLLAELEGASFVRRRDARTGHRELRVRRRRRRSRK